MRQGPVLVNKFQLYFRIRFILVHFFFSFTLSLFSIDREAFFSAVRRCAVMTTDEYKLLEFTFEDNLLQLLCTSPDVGESNVDLPIKYDGEKVVIGLNPDYVNDLSKAIDTETVTLELKDHKTACIFTEGSPRGQEGNSYTYVLMPMAIAPPSVISDRVGPALRGKSGGD